MLVEIIIIGILLILMERVIPDQKLVHSDYWYLRVIFINLLQLIIIIIAMNTWDIWFLEWKVYNLNLFAPFIEGFIAYILITFVFYWWHRIRHTNNTLWNLFHQIHHSPQRIETITSFYKHPFEIFINSILMSIINYIVFGLSIESAAWSLFYSAIGEYFYHMNIKTPHKLGYFFQRPEMHRIHHQRGKHFNNFSDLPIWDILFGTFSNPKTYDGECGFDPEKEYKIKEMILFKNVNKNNNGNLKKRKVNIIDILSILLVILGLLSVIGFITKQSLIKNIGTLFVASPLPIVFTQKKGLETFASDFYIEYLNENNRKKMIKIDSQIYSNFNAPYNYRNVVGAAVSYAPILPSNIVQSVLRFSFQEPGKLSKALGLKPPLKNAYLIIKSKTIGNNNTYRIKINNKDIHEKD